MQSALHIAAGLSFFILLSSCESGKTENAKYIAHNSAVDTVYIRDTVWLRDTVKLHKTDRWQRFFNLSHDPHRDSIWGKPVDYYISNPDCNALAFDFYYGSFRPTDNASTAELLELVLEPNEELRPFYRWCLEKTMEIADGALGEYTGQPARKYAEQYPKEFLQYMQQRNDSNTYWMWVDMISFSGLFNYSDQPEAAFEGIQERMLNNCKDCEEPEKNQIRQFALDVSKYEP